MLPASMRGDGGRRDEQVHLLEYDFGRGGQLEHGPAMGETQDDNSGGGLNRVFEFLFEDLDELFPHPFRLCGTTRQCRQRRAKPWSRSWITRSSVSTLSSFLPSSRNRLSEITTILTYRLFERNTLDIGIKR